MRTAHSLTNVSGADVNISGAARLLLEASNGGLITSSNLTSGTRVHGIVRSGGQIPLQWSGSDNSGGSGIS